MSALSLSSAARSAQALEQSICRFDPPPGYEHAQPSPMLGGDGIFFLALVLPLVILLVSHSLAGRELVPGASGRGALWGISAAGAVFAVGALAVHFLMAIIGTYAPTCVHCLPERPDLDAYAAYIPLLLSTGVCLGVVVLLAKHVRSPIRRHSFVLALVPLAHVLLASSIIGGNAVYLSAYCIADRDGLPPRTVAGASATPSVASSGRLAPAGGGAGSEAR